MFEALKNQLHLKDFGLTAIDAGLGKQYGIWTRFPEPLVNNGRDLIIQYKRHSFFFFSFFLPEKILSNPSLFFYLIIFFFSFKDMSYEM